MTDFKDIYIQLRTKEQRMYSDAEVAELPYISPNHIHYAEWKVREESCKRLISYLRKQKKPLTILEVGCGNGWLSAKLADFAGTKVKGIDANTVELQQAGNVFKNKENLSFANTSIEEEISAENKYDIVVFAASIQYFSSLDEIIGLAFSLLNSGGEIHILDTHFYNETEIAAAKKRTEKYFASMGFTQMAAFYHHHALKQLNKFNYKTLYDPNRLLNKILRQKNPFYWISIKKE